MAQTLSEFKKNPPPATVEFCGCGCENPLEKNDPLGPQLVVINGKKVLINEDCYFAKFSDGIDTHPIGGPGMHGPGCKSPID